MSGLELTVCETSSGKLVTFRRGDTTLKIKPSDRPELDVIYRQVISAVLNPKNRLLELVYLWRKKKKGSLVLARITGKVQNKEEDEALAAWVDMLMHDIYEGSGIKRERRLKILINPHGGVKKGAAIFIKAVEPIFRSAQCILDITYTTHVRHAYEIAKELNVSLNYDAVVTVSGDGIIHEVLNGFARHENPKKALSIPIAPIPTGSGNGLALNLLGRELGFDVTEAALNVIKGRPMPVDVFSIAQNGKRTVSFMSQALGLMADADIGTENLRWMGDTRFLVGILRGIILFKSCPVQLSYKLVENDKVKMAERARAQRLEGHQDALPSEASGSLPPLNYLPDDTDGWVTCDEPILYLYAGKGPFVSRDFMAFPVSIPNDGLIDIMTAPASSRINALSAIGGAEKGENFWNPELRYVKARAYRVKPLSKKGFLSVDGEMYPFEEFQVEVHQGLATLLSPYGHYAVDFPSGVHARSVERVGR